MRYFIHSVVTLCASLIGAASALSADGKPLEEVIALERAALDQWGNGDPRGFLETYAPEITYFDTATQHRLDGIDVMTDYLRPLSGKIKVASYEMIDPKVQRHGDVAVLTYNLRSEAALPDGKTMTVHWNSTAVYARTGRQWKSIHSHWSLTAPPCLAGTQ